MTEAMVRTSQPLLVNSGATTTGNINLVGTHGRFAVSVPTIASASSIFVQVGPSSGNYAGRMFDPTSQSAWSKNVGNGSCSLVVDAWPWPHARLELSLAAVTPLSLQALTMGQRAGVGPNRE